MFFLSIKIPKTKNSTILVVTRARIQKAVTAAVGAKGIMTAIPDHSAGFLLCCNSRTTCCE